MWIKPTLRGVIWTKSASSKIFSSTSFEDFFESNSPLLHWEDALFIDVVCKIMNTSWLDETTKTESEITPNHRSPTHTESKQQPAPETAAGFFMSS